jgi:hypothetical protein
MTEKSIEQLVEEALDAFDDPGASTSSLLRRAIRIAAKRQDYAALIRLIPETQDMTTGQISDAMLRDARVNLELLLGSEEAERLWLAAARRHITIRTIRGQRDKVRAESISQLEASLAQLAEVSDSYRKPPDNLTPIDTYHVARSYDAAAAKLLPLRRDLENLLERVKQDVHDFLIETERQIELGQRRPHIFDRAREYIEGALRGRAPDALEKFRAAEKAVESGQPEDLAHALTSCRRMIKALADALYPATNQMIVGIDGRERCMSDDLYRNRLLEYVTQRLRGGTHADLVKETFRSLDNRLKRLNELSSKGVHDAVTRAEAETCIMWTYLTAADILRIDKQSTSSA